MNSDKTQSIYPNDICVTAPTGSGKTLTYVLPIIQSLKNRIQPCCRAIVLLPVTDLAEQVYNIFKTQLMNTEENSHLIDSKQDCLNEGPRVTNSLKVMLLSSKTPFAKEQAQLINPTHNRCLIDIIVTTPGRLVDHIQKTTGFCLKEVRYLVLDECDRIMDQIKHNWLSLLNQAVFGNADARELLSQDSLNVHNLFEDKKKLVPYQKLLLSATLTRNPEKLEQVNLFKPIYFNVAAEKLINSTIEKTPVLVAAEKAIKEVVAAETNSSLKARLENVENSADINLPDELNECLIEVVASQKPLTAIYLIKTLGYRRMLCFVRTIDTAKRLNKLFELNNITSMEYSSSLHVARRKRVQAKFEQDKIDVLVCSDVMARGMDLENVDYVLLYDSVKFLNSYVHKVGRTARAGKPGTAISFLEHKEIFFFKKMMAQINTPDKQAGGDQVKEKPKHKVKEIKIQKSKFKPLLNDYKNSLLKLKESLSGKPTSEKQESDDNDNENNGEVTPKQPEKRKHLKERNLKFVKRIKNHN